jgi:hypothetical protein
MSVEFDENNFSRTTPRFASEQKSNSGSKMGDWLIRNGIATSPNAANIILLILGILVFAISFYIFIYGFNLPTQQRTVDPGLFPPGVEL